MDKIDYPKMDIQEIKRRLVPLGYNIIDGDYQSKKGPVFLGLILRKGDNETVFADIRQHEGQVVVPYREKAVPKELSKLVKDLNQAEIPFRRFENTKKIDS
jgi:hypothetical protein